MELFEYKPDRVIRIYARTPQDIVNLVQHYHTQAHTTKGLDDPSVPNWVKHVPSIDALFPVREGELFVPPELQEQRNGCEVIPVCNDFVVYIEPGAVQGLADFRTELPNLRRENLYKIQLNGGSRNALTFVPEDIMGALVACDLAPYLGRALKTSKTTQQKTAIHWNGKKPTAHKEKS